MTVGAMGERGEAPTSEAARGSAAAERRLLGLGLTIAVATVTAQSVAHLVNVLVLDDRFLHLNADDEHGLAAWTSSSATFIAAFAVFLLALADEHVNRRLVALAGILAYLSLDDAVTIHERLSEKISHAAGYGDVAERMIWPVVFLPLFLAGLLLLIDASRGLARRPRRLVAWGIGLLALALAAEVFSSALYAFADVERGSWPDALEVVVEEGAELAAWILVATAFLAAVLSARDEDPPVGRRRIGA